LDQAKDLEPRIEVPGNISAAGFDKWARALGHKLARPEQWRRKEERSTYSRATNKKRPAPSMKILPVVSFNGKRAFGGVVAVF
jgi:hypothetical protein